MRARIGDAVPLTACASINVTGKGVENPGLRPTMGGPPVEICPSLLGGTGWQPKSYNPKAGVLYIPSNEFCMRYAYVADLAY